MGTPFQFLSSDLFTKCFYFYYLIYILYIYVEVQHDTQIYILGE